MSADGQTLLACWAHRPGQASALPSPSTAAGAQLSRLSGAAAVFTWNGYGQSLHALQLPVPQGGITAMLPAIGSWHISLTSATSSPVLDLCLQFRPTS
jgi:hypothetical protein